MNRNKLILLGLLSIALIVVALIARETRNAGPEDAVIKVFPALTDNLAEVSRIALIEGGKDPVVPSVTLQRDGEHWGVEERGGYPGQIKYLRKLLRAVSELEAAETMTANPAYHGRLGLLALNDPESTAQGLRIEIKAGKPLGTLLFGNAAARGADSGSYVRMADQVQTWRVDGDVDLRMDPDAWLEKDIISVPRERLQSIDIRHADGSKLQISRDSRSEPNLLVQDPPKDKELLYAGVGNGPAGAIAQLQLESVQRLQAFDFSDKDPTTTIFRAFDGLVITAITARVGSEYFLHLQASYDAALAERFAVAEDEASETAEKASTQSVQEEAKVLNEKLSPWVYRIATYKYQMFTKRMQDMLKPPPETAEELGE